MGVINYFPTVKCENNDEGGLTSNQKCSFSKSKHFYSRILTPWLSSRAMGYVIGSSGSYLFKTDEIFTSKQKGESRLASIGSFLINLQFVFLQFIY